LTLASLWEQGPEPADSEHQPVTVASRLQLEPEPADGGEDQPLATASPSEPEPADGEHQPVTVASRLQLEPEPADRSEDQPLATASPSEPEPADRSEDKPSIAATSSEPEPVDRSEHRPLTLASWEQGTEPADRDHQPLVVAWRWQPEPEPVDRSEDQPLAAASPPPAKLQERPAGPPMVLASLGPAPRAPAAERPVFRRDAPGIWTGGMSYEPPALDPLVADWRVHGEAFAAFTAPDQVHLAGLTRAPEQILSVRFARGPVRAPYAEAFVGAAVAPIEVAELAAPIVTAAR
jgi:hypothetical protein